MSKSPYSTGAPYNMNKSRKQSEMSTKTTPTFGKKTASLLPTIFGKEVRVLQRNNSKKGTQDKKADIKKPVLTKKFKEKEKTGSFKKKEIFNGSFRKKDGRQSKQVLTDCSQHRRKGVLDAKNKEQKKDTGRRDAVCDGKDAFSSERRAVRVLMKKF